MSYISCVNSVILPERDYPVGSIGSVIAPTVNLVAVASNTALQAIPDTVLPEGVWLISGILFFDAVTGAQTLTGETSISIDGISRWRSSNPLSAEDGLSITLSYRVISNGADVLSIPSVYTTSGGANYGLSTQPLSVVQCVRIA